MRKIQVGLNFFWPVYNTFNDWTRSHTNLGDIECRHKVDIKQSERQISTVQLPDLRKVHCLSFPCVGTLATFNNGTLQQ